jgi:hypothetical protein
LGRRLGGPQRRSEKKNSQLQPRLETPVTHPVAQRYTTELSRLHEWMVKITIRSYVIITYDYIN